MMKVTISSLVIYLFTASILVNAQQNEIKNNEMVKMDHSHMPIAVPSGVEPLSLSLALTKDSMSGYNLKLLTQHYVLTSPPNGVDMAALMTPSLDQQTGFLMGHAHLYINGEKIQRIYGHNIHLPQSRFSQGTNSISVSLNNHGHMYWTNANKKVVATLYIDSNEPPLIKHKFESFPVTD